MSEKPKPAAPDSLLLPSPNELLRSQVIAELRSKLDSGRSVDEAVAEIAARMHFIIQSGEATSVTSRSVYRWWSRFMRIPRKLITDSAVKLIGHSTGSRSPAPA